MSFVASEGSQEKQLLLEIETDWTYKITQTPHEEQERWMNPPSWFLFCLELALQDDTIFVGNDII